ncbi:SIS domain-containing protein [Sphingomonas paeninsulae]|uniref:Phosphoheptose isomerase n=1 Tax=Sphingomonas paeninsulae TaxID=2319844 RepID=A0A494TMT4_SPHPE|nr:SIS domain-containing protein [Sphingomonas paeninsulae]AYJ87126.1 SIS domain-containing protein [Sphingomonas paeninsulae]
MAYSIVDDVAIAIAELRRALTPEFAATIVPSAEALAEALQAGKKILIMGNGGSAADAQHIAAELVGRFKIERRGLAAIALTTDSSVLTAWSNDYAYETVFSRQVEALAQPDDVVWGISTSGNSTNVMRAFEAAHAIGATTLGLLGRSGGKLAAMSDFSIVVPLEHTDQIQSAHQIVYHAICAYLDTVFQPADA